MSTFRVIVGVLIGAFCAAPLHAQGFFRPARSPSASFDMQHIATAQVTVRDFHLNMPHTWFFAFASDSAGDQRVMGFESASSPILTHRYGWTQRSLAPGERVTVEFHPFLNPRQLGGMVVKVVTADGHELNGGSADDFVNQRTCGSLPTVDSAARGDDS